LDSRIGIEVMVANDLSANHLWDTPQDVGSSAAPETFSMRNVALPRGVAVGANGAAQAGMGIATDDLEGDGDLDLVVSNFSDESNNVYKQHADGLFIDVSGRDGMREISLPFVGFGAVLGDFNRDGTRNLFLANGHVNMVGYESPDDAAPESDKVDLRPYIQPAAVLQFRDGRWTKSQTGGTYFNRSHIGRAVASLDFDRSGTLDLAVTHTSEKFCLLSTKNPVGKPSNAMISIRLVGRSTQRAAVGSRVFVQTDKCKRTMHRVAGGSYMASHTQQLSTGISSSETLETISVHWPCGEVQSLGKLELNCEWLIVQGTAPIVCGTYTNSN
ncbi:MAG: FG-GAP-like repeat-containing protein, partial [Planctomycetota bacterium]